MISKIRSLPPERVAEVEAFVDYLLYREDGANLSAAASKLSESSFQEVSDNPEDADYDRLCFTDVILVPFPFTEQTATKKRPA